jgi:hypothetical protein
MKKRLSEFGCLLLLLFTFFGAIFSLIQLRLMSSGNTDFLTLSAPIRTVDSNAIVSASSKIDDATTALFLSDHHITIATLKNILSLKDKKEFLMLPRADFLNTPSKVTELKSVFPNLTPEIAILMDSKTSDNSKNIASLGSIQSRLNTAFNQQHTFLIVKHKEHSQ